MITRKQLAEANREYLELLGSDLFSFSLKCFHELYPREQFVENWSVEAVVHELEQVYAGKTTQLIINLPPRSLKSHLVSVAFSAFLLGNEPSLKIVCTSYSQDFADKLSRQFRQIVESDWYRRIFPKLALLRSTTSEVLTTLGGGRFATSINGTLTGIGVDVGLIDEPTSSQEAQSDTARKNANEWFAGTFTSRLNNKKTGRVVVVMQRLHEEDLSGYLLAQGGWKVLALPAIAPETRIVPITHGRRHVWNEAEALNPGREDLGTLAKEKAKVGSYHFSAQYLQEPVPSGGGILKVEWLQQSPDRLLPRPGFQIVQSWDTGFKISDGSSYSVCETFLVQSGNEAHLIDVFRERLEYPELTKFVIEHARRCKANAILIEDKASGQSLIQSARREGLPGIIAREPEGDKRARMIFETPKLEAKSLFLPKTASWKDAFLHEYRAFPNGRYSDQIDALSQFLNWWKDRSVFQADFGKDDDDHGGAPDAETIASLMSTLRPPWR